MKIFKRFSFLLVMSFLIFGLSGCDLFGGGTVNEVATPQNFQIENGVASWDAVSNAEGYKISIDNVVSNLSTTTYDLNNEGLAVGSHSVKVAAYLGDFVSSYTTALTFVVEQPTISTLSSPSNVTITDGVLSWDTVENALSYTVEIDGEVVEEVTGNSFVLGDMDLYAGEHTIRVRAKRGAIASQFSNSYSYQLQPLASSAEIYAAILAIIDEDYAPNMVLNDFEFEYEYENYLAASTFALRYSQTTANMMMTREHAIGLVQFIKDFVMSLDSAESVADVKTALDGLASYDLTPTKFANLLINLADSAIVISQGKLSDPLYGDETGLMVVNTLQGVLEDNEDLVRDNLVNTIDFGLNLYGHISANMVTYLNQLMANGTLSETEAFALKDEMVSMFQQSIPSVEVISQMYQLVLVVGNAFVDFDINTMLAHTTTLATLTRQSANLLLEFVGEFSLEDMNTMGLYVENSFQEVEYVCGQYFDGQSMVDFYCYDQELNFESFVDALVYFGTYANNFYLSHETEFALIGALPVRDLMIDFADVFAGAVKVYLQEEMTIQEYIVASAMIDMILEEVPNVLDGIQILANIGIEEISLFISSEAQMVYDIYDAVGLFMSEGNVMVLISDIEAILDQFVDYNAIIVNNLSQENIETLLMIAKIPVIIETYGSADFATFNALFTDLPGQVAGLIADVLFLENTFVNVVSNYDVSASLTAYGFEMNQAAMVTAILVLDQFLTTDVENMIFDDIDVVFDSVLVNQAVAANIQLPADAATMKAEIESMLTSYILEIRTIADFDFNNMTQTQWDEIYALTGFLAPQ